MCNQSGHHEDIRHGELELSNGDSQEDELFVLSKANVHFVKIIRDTLLEFQALSSLKPNIQESEIFVSTTTTKRKGKISEILGMPLGVLP